MKSRYSHILTLIGALLAFVPIMAVDYLLDSYVRVREKEQTRQYVAGVTSQIEIGVNDAIGALRRILAESPSLCTPTFVANVQREIETRLSMKQVLVENSDGVQYCDAFGRTVAYSPLSENLPVPGHTETITLVQLGDLAMPALKITQTFGQTRRVSAFMPLMGQTSEGLTQALPSAAMMRVMLTNGTPVLTIGAHPAPSLS